MIGQDTCECNHPRSYHRDKDGNCGWICADEKDRGIGACFNGDCRCKGFENFSLDVAEIRLKEKRK